MASEGEKMVRDLAKRLGATIEFDRDNYPGRAGSTRDDELRATAPAYHRWVDGGVHELIETAKRGDKEIWASMYARMLWGVEPCPPDCEWCYPEEEDGQ